MYNETLRFRTKIAETEATGRKTVSTMAFAQSFQKECFATLVVGDGLSQPGCKKDSCLSYISRVCRCRAKKSTDTDTKDTASDRQLVSVQNESTGSPSNILIFYYYCRSSLERSSVHDGEPAAAVTAT